RGRRLQPSGWSFLSLERLSRRQLSWVVTLQEASARRDAHYSGSRRGRELEELGYTFAAGAFSFTCANLDFLPRKRYCWRKDEYPRGGRCIFRCDWWRRSLARTRCYSMRSRPSMGPSRTSGMSPTATFGREWRGTWFRPRRRRSQTTSSMIRKAACSAPMPRVAIVLEALAALMRPLT